MNAVVYRDSSTEKIGRVTTSTTVIDIAGHWTKSRPTPHDVVITLNNTPVVERSVKITFTCYGKEYIIEDIPKCDGSTEGYLWSHERGAKRGQAWIKDSSYIDYETGKVYIYFRDPPELPDDEMNNIYSTITVRRYIKAGSNAVPAPAFTSGKNTGRPDPINILRTIRSYDPCLACSIHVIDGRGVRKYEVIPVTGWEVK